MMTQEYRIAIQVNFPSRPQVSSGYGPQMGNPWQR
jgi:hypothetical protein